MTSYGTWVSYAGFARVELAAGLLLVAAALAWLSLRVRAPVRVARPGVVVLTCLIVILTLGVSATVAGALVDLVQEQQAGVAHAPAPNPISPVTVTAAIALFVVLAIATPRGLWTRLLTAGIGAAAAPMIFELPFDLIVIARIHSPIHPHPVLSLLVFFLPLFLVEVSTLTLLTWPPTFRVTRTSLALLAAMFAVFAAWALDGFGYPSSPLAISANVVSKLLAFAVAASLLLPERKQAPAAGLRLASPVTPVQSRR